MEYGIANARPAHRPDPLREDTALPTLPKRKPRALKPGDALTEAQFKALANEPNTVVVTLPGLWMPPPDFDWPVVNIKTKATKGRPPPPKSGKRLRG
jgi:hypothetical protein